MNILDIRQGIVGEIQQHQSQLERLTAALRALDGEGGSEPSDTLPEMTLQKRRFQTAEVRARIGASTRARHERNRLAREAQEKLAKSQAQEPTEPKAGV